MRAKKKHTQKTHTHTHTHIMQRNIHYIRIPDEDNININDYTDEPR
jgi:hypothetical protein